MKITLDFAHDYISKLVADEAWCIDLRHILLEAEGRGKGLLRQSVPPGATLRGFLCFKRLFFKNKTHIHVELGEL